MAAFKVTCTFESQPQEVISFVLTDKAITTRLIVDKVLSILHKNEIRNLSEMVIDQKSGDDIAFINKRIVFTRAGDKSAYINVISDEDDWGMYRDGFYDTKYGNSFSCILCFC